SVIAGNHSVGAAGGAIASDKGFHNELLIISNSWIDGNALSPSYRDRPVAGQTVVNDNTSGGGAIFWGGASVDFLNSTVSNNRTYAPGGEEIENVGGNGGAVAATFQVTATNTTFAQNEALGDGADGGAIFANRVVLRNSTVTANHAEGHSGGVSVDAFLDVTTPGFNDNEVVLENSILAGNTSGQAEAGDDDFWRVERTILRDTGDTLRTPILTRAGGSIIDQGVGGIFEPGENGTVLRDVGGRVPLVPLLNSTSNPALDASSGDEIAPGDATAVAAQDLPGVGSDDFPTTRDLGAFELILPVGGLDGPMPTPEDDDLPGTSLDDEISALAGDDFVRGFGGRDTLNGDAGNDRIIGDGGNDDLSGGAGADRISGNAGNDRLRGDAGNDTLWAGAGKDTLEGGAGRDQLIGGGGNDRLIAGKGDDDLIGQGGNDLALGGAGKDFADGGNGRDDLRGEGGRDELRGGGGADQLDGGGGRDLIAGGRGSDDLRGGAGRDLFLFARGDGRDDVLDWRDGQDRIVLEGERRFSNVDVDQRGKHVLIDYGKRSDVVKVFNADADDFSAKDFLFA
ncbi:MAG: calcium-binding protein, partial [Pseudomonadota bacterium]